MATQKKIKFPGGTEAFKRMFKYFWRAVFPEDESPNMFAIAKKKLKDKNLDKFKLKSFRKINKKFGNLARHTAIYERK